MQRGIASKKQQDIKTREKQFAASWNLLQIAFLFRID
jgi:hypothetical protein